MNGSIAQDPQQKPMPPSRALLFVEVEIDGKKRSKQSRAHVAWVTRQRQKQERLNENAKLTRDNCSQSSSSLSTSNASGVVAQNPPPLRRTVAPVFGALRNDAFATKDSIEAAEIASFCFGPVMNSWLEPQHKPAWIAAFFDYPLYHSLSFSVGIMKDVRNNRAIQLRRIKHQIKTIQLVNQQLDQLDSVDHEPIMLAISSPWRINLDEIAAQKAVPLLFTPHLRQASFIATYGRLGGGGPHPAALLHLVHRRGGLGQFKTLPSLQESLALADLMDSSAHATRPRFGKIWDTESFLRHLKPALAKVSSDVEGRGFFERVPGGVPIETTTALQHLSFVDKLVDDYSTRSVSTTEDFYLAALANTAQHEALSRPPWAKLPDQAADSRSSYEICRVASILYSNSAIFPISPSSPWLEKLLRQLRRLVETSPGDIRSKDEVPVVMWALVIGGIAAFWTGHRTFFLEKIRQGLMRSYRTSSLQELLPELRAFLWRDSSCLRGATTLWEVLERDEAIGGDRM